MKVPLLLTLAAAALAALIISCGDAKEEIGPEPTATAATSVVTQAPTPTTAPTASVPPDATLTYTDPTYGYSFDYPAGWFLTTPKENGGSNLVLYSYNPSATSGTAGTVPNDKLKAVIRVQEGVDKPVEQWLAESRNLPGQPPPPTILSTSPVTIGGKAGLLEVSEYDGEKSVAYYIVLGGGRLLIIGAAPAESGAWVQFESVMSSLHLES